MYKNLIAITLGIIFVSSAATLTGCSNKTASISTSEDESGSSSNAESETQVVAANASPTEQSPAILGSEELDKFDSPDIVCQQFLESLRSDEGINAGHHLTNQALMETRRAELELEAPGSEVATYEIGKVYYADMKKLVAQVECFITEPDAAGSSKLLWILKRGKHGWKIAGMMMQEPGEIPDLISFESREDVTRIKSALDDTIDMGVERNAALPDTANTNH